jgi:RNA polymerase sigma-70 factor (ECF subfamily)
LSSDAPTHAPRSPSRDGGHECAYKSEFCELVVAELSGLFRYVLAILRHSQEAEDVVQQTLMTAFERWDVVSVKDGQQRRGWLRAVARNHAMHSIRSRRRTEDDDRELIEVANSDDPAVSAVDRVALRAVRDEINNLPNRQRLTLLMISLGFQLDEIARILDMTPSTVRSTLRHARNRIRESCEAVADDSLATELGLFSDRG